jgi:hypothetical protein
MRLLSLFTFLILVNNAQAQDITGRWHGSFKTESTVVAVSSVVLDGLFVAASVYLKHSIPNEELGGTLTHMSELIAGKWEYEFEITRDSGFLKLVTWSRKKTYYGKAVGKATIDPISKKVITTEQRFIETSTPKEEWAFTNGTLQYSKKGKREFLKGTFVAYSVTNGMYLGKGIMSLEKIIEPTKPQSASTRKKAKHKPQEMATDTLDHNKNEIPLAVKNRQNEVAQTITTKSKKVILNIYDNGIVDGDTISVYVDGKLLLRNALLTEKPLVLELEMDKTNNYHEVLMVAENLGSVPPNTSLMIVKAGKQEYEVHISSSLQKNATVIFKYE